MKNIINLPKIQLLLPDTCVKTKGTSGEQILKPELLKCSLLILGISPIEHHFNVNWAWQWHFEKSICSLFEGYFKLVIRFLKWRKASGHCSCVPAEWRSAFGEMSMTNVLSKTFPQLLTFPQNIFIFEHGAVFMLYSTDKDKMFSVSPFI